MAYMTQDGSIIDRAGKVLYFSTQRFVDDICLGDCCFICGAKPEEKPFNNEHILPEWLLRRYDLFSQSITLPNDRRVRYGGYTIPCCKECNTLMGRVIETPISRAVQAGTKAIIDYVQKDGGLKFFIWMGLIFLKIHLKDRAIRVDPDFRKASEKIGDRYEWDDLHHLHCVVRSFYSGCEVAPEAVGSCLALPVRTEDSEERFDLGDFSFAQTMLLRLDNTALITVFNDASISNGWLGKMIERITGPVSKLQLREILAEYSYLNLRLKERPVFQTEGHTLTETCRIIANRGSMELDDTDQRIRGKLLQYMLRDVLPSLRFRDATNEEVMASIEAGNFSFLFDEHGNFFSK